MPAATVNNQAEIIAGLALSAATQIDRLQRNLNADLVPIRGFAQTLTTLAQTPDLGLALDPASSQMFGVAVSNVIHKDVSSISSLQQELITVAHKIMSLPDDPAVQDKDMVLSSFKEFCLSIHDRMVSGARLGVMNERGVFDYDLDFTG